MRKGIVMKKRRRVKLIGRVFQAILFGGLALLPLVFWPSAPVPYEVPRVVAMHVWVVVLIVVGLARVLANRRMNRVDSKLVFLVLGFVGWAVVSALLGADWNKSLAGNYYRADGLMTLFYLMGLYLAVSSWWRDAWRMKLIGSVSWGSVGVSGWTVLQCVVLVLTQGWNGGPWGGAVGATFGNPNFLAGYLVVTLPFVAQWWEQVWGEKKSVWRGGGLALVCLAIVLTRSWGGILGLIVFWMLWVEMRVRGKAKFSLVGGVVVLLGLAFWLGINLGGMYAPEARVRIVNKMLRGWQLKPITGWGWANADYAFTATDWPMHYQHDVYVDKTHSQLLEVLVTAGVVGLGLYVLIIGLVFKRLREIKTEGWRRLLVMIFVMYVVHAQTNIISIGEEVIFWLAVGVVTTMNQGVEGESGE